MTLPAHSLPAWPLLLAAPSVPQWKDPPQASTSQTPGSSRSPPSPLHLKPQPRRFASPWPLVWSANTHAFHSIIHSLSSIKHSSGQNTQGSRHHLLTFTLVHRHKQHLTSLPSPKSQWAHTGRPGHHPILLHGPQASWPQGPPQTPSKPQGSGRHCRALSLSVFL